MPLAHTHAAPPALPCRHADKKDEIDALTAAYQRTQPVPIFQQPSDEEEDAEA